MILVGSGVSFRNNGLNSLPSIQHIGDFLNEPSMFKDVIYNTSKTIKFVRNSK